MNSNATARKASRMGRVALVGGWMLMTCVAAWAGQPAQMRWIDQLPGLEDTASDPGVVMHISRRDKVQIERRQSSRGTPMRIGSQTFERGLGTRANCDIVIHANEPIVRFTALVGVDRGADKTTDAGSVVFAVYGDRTRLYQSGVLRGGMKPEAVNIDTGTTRWLHLRVGDAWDGSADDHADWADARIELASGRSVWVDEIAEGIVPAVEPGPCFSFVYDGRDSGELLERWRHERKRVSADQDCTLDRVVWSEPDGGLQIVCHLKRFRNEPATEWLLTFTNRGDRDTGRIERVRSLDAKLLAPCDPMTPYRLYRTNGAPSNMDDFAARTVALQPGDHEVAEATEGRSSNRDLPFFKLDTGIGSLVLAVGWSGNWQADFTCDEDHRLGVSAELCDASFVLRPGETVRTPRIVMLHSPGETWDANARFRSLVYRHYAARRAGKRPLPLLFANTCFVEGGGWLGDLNTAENQIELIRAYAKLGIEAVVTDAGWMAGSQGAWWKGCGNWHQARTDNYPQGMAPVGKAAEEAGLVYGLWHEIETVVHGTWLHLEHPEWLIDAGHRTVGDTPAALLNFGRPEVPQWAADQVLEMLALPGFGFYRQDFGLIPPSAHWQANDAPDRRGISENHHVTGLYAFWEKLADGAPAAWREECAAGGRRIDLETVMRMHIHQKSDFWFNNLGDQLSLWGLSQYLPNSCVVAQLNRLDDYSFHSTLPASLCVGWKAADPDFDADRARDLVRRYKSVRHLLVGAWYPLMPYSRQIGDWQVTQYHRDDLDAGLILAFRRRQSSYRVAEVSCRGIDPHGRYRLRYDTTGKTREVDGHTLTDDFCIELADPPRSEMIVYEKTAAADN